MKVSYLWLQTYFDTKLPTPEDLESVIALHAFEIDGIDQLGNDYVIDVDVLPNRSSDAFSHRGIAKEVSALINVPLKSDPFVDIPKVVTDSNLKTSDHAALTIEHPDVCRRSLKRLAINVTVGESPQWLKDRLETLGQRPINNVVDITNYIMLDLGQPVHAFDFDKLAGEKKNIVIRRGKTGEQITTLDEETYELDETIPVIADESGPMDIGGIKGGAHTGIDTDTTRVLLSVSSFDPVMVRKAARKLKLRTDASARFENDVPQEFAVIAMEHFSQMLADICGATIAEDVLDEYPRTRECSDVSVSAEDATALLGMEITDEVVEDVLTRLQFPFTKKREQFVVTPPFERTDVNITEDVIEEIGRVYGYDHLKSVLPPAFDNSHINKRRYYEDRIRDLLAKKGFSEVYTYSLCPQGEIELENPLSKDRAFMRATLRDGLENSLALNDRNKPLLGLEEIKLFEIGTVFKKEGEHVALGICVSGKKGDTLVKEVTNLLASDLGLKLEVAVKNGFVEINLDEFFEKLPDPPKRLTYDLPDAFVVFKPFSQYPFVLRDIAVWVPEGKTADEIADLIRGQGSDLLIRLDLFDEFNKDGRVSYAFHLVFQSYEKTLSDEEVNKIMEQITKKLESEAFEVR